MKTKYETNIEPHLDKVSEWAQQDISEEEIATRLDVSYSRFRDYKNQHSALSAALKKALDLKTEQVEGSLFNNAIGGVITLKKPYKLKKKVFKDGKVIREEEIIQIVDEEVYVKPDTLAQMYWLNNRAPDRWKAKPIDDDCKLNNPISVNINFEDCSEAENE